MISIVLTPYMLLLIATKCFINEAFSDYVSFLLRKLPIFYTSHMTISKNIKSACFSTRSLLSTLVMDSEFKVNTATS